MTQHVSNLRNKRFCVRALPVEELTTIAKHLDTCSTCLDQFTKTLQSGRGSEPLKFTLAPEFWFRNEHVDYEQLVRLADSTLDATEQEVIDIHRKVCASCNEDVRSFLKFREQIAPEMAIFDIPASPPPSHEESSSWVWWRALTWKPAYVSAIVILGIAIVITVAMKRRAASLQTSQTPHQNNNPVTRQTPTPEIRSARNNPAPPAPLPSNEVPRPIRVPH